MNFKIRLEDIYRYLLTAILWKVTFIAQLSWIAGARVVANQVSSLCTRLILFLVVIYIIFKSVKKPSLYDLATVAVLICAYLSYRVVDDDTFMYAAILVMLAKPFDIERTLKLYFKNMVLIIVSILIVLCLGLTNNKMVDFTYAVGYSLGTGHPNVIAALLLNTTLLGIALYLKNSPERSIVLSIIVAVVIYVITASRTSSILLLVFSIVYLLYLIMKKTKTQWIMNALKLTMVGVVAFSIYMMVNGGRAFGVNDTNFYVRFLQASRILKTYGIHLWGSNITFVSITEAAQTGVTPVILDNGYLRLLLYYGLVALVIFVVGIMTLIRKIGKQKDYILLLIVALFLAGGLMEKTVYSIQLNFTLILITTSIEDAFDGWLARN